MQNAMCICILQFARRQEKIDAILIGAVPWTLRSHLEDLLTQRTRPG
jgi:hypothetical protein